MKLSLTATRLRMVLSISLFGILLITGGAFFYIDQQLQSYAVTVSHSVADASASQNSLQTLQELQQTLNNDADVIAKTNSIVADSQSYQYQDQLTNDLNGYASQSGIDITDINFPSTSTPATGTTAPTTATTAPVAAPSGVKSVTVDVTLKNPIDYNSFLQFIHAIENNLTRMQIQSISLSSGANSNVSSDILTIQVYVR